MHVPMKIICVLGVHVFSYTCTSSWRAGLWHSPSQWLKVVANNELPENLQLPILFPDFINFRETKVSFNQHGIRVKGRRPSIQL